MSSLEAKLIAPEKSQGERPRATLRQLQKRWGASMEGPDAVKVDSMEIEQWSRVHGTGPDSIWERVDLKF